MLFRRFFLVASLIALMGASLANLIQFTKHQRDIVLEYPGISGLSRCSADLRCATVVSSARLGA